jgi:hypothetical protein
MPVNRYATAAGRKYQRDVMKFMRDDLGLDAENLVLTGAEDEGDIVLKWWARDTLQRVVFEAKREKGFHLADWIKQAEIERDNYTKHRGLGAGSTGFAVVHARRQHGIAQSYVTLPLNEYLIQIGVFS